MQDTFLLGAVAYDPKVVTIWEGFRDWLKTRDFDFDFVLFSNYERQVAAHFDGVFHAAWNSPLAWVQTQRIAQARGVKARHLCMRDSDQGLSSLIVIRSDSGIENLNALRGKTVAVGAPDSPQATLIPLNHLANAGLHAGEDFQVREFDLLFGKHGDHVGGEREAAKALMRGEVDACCMIDFNHMMFTADGTFDAGATKILARTEPYDHCIFTTISGIGDDSQLERFNALLLEMSYEDPAVRHLLDLEGLKQWKPGRTSGFGQLDEACSRFGYIDEFVKSLS